MTSTPGGLCLYGEPVAAIALDYGGYAVTFAVSQLSQRVVVSSICSPALLSWNLGRLSRGLMAAIARGIAATGPFRLSGGRTPGAGALLGRLEAGGDLAAGGDVQLGEDAV